MRLGRMANNDLAPDDAEQSRPKMPLRMGRIAVGVLAGMAILLGVGTVIQGSAMGRRNDDARVINAVRRATRSSSQADTDMSKIARVTLSLLAQQHYSRQTVDDKIAGQLINLTLDSLDPQHFYFLKSDIAEFDALKTDLAAHLNNGDTSAAQTIYARFKERFDAQTAYVRDLLKTEKFTFTGNENYLLDHKTQPYPETLDDAKQLWRQELRYEYLSEKLQKMTPEKIVETLDKRYARSERAVHEYDGDDIFEAFLTNLAHVYDPHTDYFGKANAEKFSIELKLSLFGIGAQLTSEDGYAVIDTLIPGGPAAKSGKIKPKDKIAGVAQGDSGEFVETMDMKLDKVVEMIRGPKGTKVRLNLIPTDAADPSVRRQVVLVRDQIKLEDQAAKARLIETTGTDGKPVRLGVIDLPSFYFDPRNNKSATEDTKRLITRLKKENVSGIVLDLRRNGGGSLPEAISLTGLFIKSGPVVQVRDPEGNVQQERDDDNSIAYDGPLIVLTSRLSASASEILAGALQDYGRALIVGDSSTFGKGTVQSLIELKDIMGQAGLQTKDDPGQLKLTIQKFYRPSGSSTQLRGVASDIVIPSIYEYVEIGERSLKNPLPWDTIPSASFDHDTRLATLLPELKRRSAQRLKSDPDLLYLEQQTARFKKIRDDKTVSLNEEKRLKETNEAQARVKKRQAELAARPAVRETVYQFKLSDLDKPGLPAPFKEDIAAVAIPALGEDTGANGASNPPKGIRERDIDLDEAKRILLDLSNLEHKTVAAKR